MPKIDPITGCKVQTIGEYFSSEAEREGKGRGGGELMSEMFDEIEADNQAEAARQAQPEVALALLRKQAAGFELPMPVEILEVLESEHRWTFGGSTESLKARVRVEGGATGTLSWWASSTPATMLDPPDYDCDLVWERAGRLHAAGRAIAQWYQTSKLKKAVWRVQRRVRYGW